MDRNIESDKADVRNFLWELLLSNRWFLSCFMVIMFAGFQEKALS